MAAIKNRYRIIIAEDHTLFREGLKALLSLVLDFEVVGEAGDGIAAIRCVEKLKPDLALVDLTMPKMDGFTTIKELKRRYPETKILVLTGHKAEEFVLETLKSGADGYVVKEADQRELLLAIRSVLQEKRYLSPDISAKVIDGYLDGRKTLRPKSTWETLTARERQVLKLIAEGYKSREIGDLLCISEKTVAKHRANIMKKLDLHSASALTAYAMDRGLVER